MNSNQLASLVKEMRDAQKKYFKERTQSALTASKDLEKKVDQEVEKILNREVQTNLF
jgi:hypothetical protein